MFGGLIAGPKKVQTHTSLECDIAMGLVVGGVKANHDEFPHMAAIGYENLDREISFKCGGSLIRFIRLF
jgi:hypothetical protein